MLVMRFFKCPDCKSIFALESVEADECDDSVSCPSCGELNSHGCTSDSTVDIDSEWLDR